MIKLYFHHTPNPLKVALFLEEAGLRYEVVPVDLFKGEQHSPEFRAKNPNGKVPAILDDGVTVFDSSAILLYLAEKTGQFLGSPGDRPALLSWLMFVASGLGPFSGQAAHFSQVYADSPYATNRYRRELERHYAVLDRHLGGRPYLVGDSYTIVDMAAWGWVDRAGYNLKQDAPLDRWSNLKLWFGNIDSRPAVARASSVGRDAVLKTEFDEETLRLSSRRIFPKSPEVRQNANLAGGKTR